MFKDEIQLNVETEVIHATVRKLDKEWQFISAGWDVYLKPTDLTVGECLDERQWPRDSAGNPTKHIPVKELKDGLEVIWKGNFFDYLWNFGIIKSEQWAPNEEFWIIKSENRWGDLKLVNGHYETISIVLLNLSKLC